MGGLLSAPSLVRTQRFRNYAEGAAKSAGGGAAQDDAVVGGLGLDRQIVGHRLDEGVEVARVEHAADVLGARGRVANDDLALGVAVHPLDRPGQGLVVEDDLTLLPGGGFAQ